MLHQRWRAVVGGRESRRAFTPTFHFCVSDDPLNSSGGTEENLSLKFSPTAYGVVKVMPVFVQACCVYSRLYFLIRGEGQCDLPDMSPPSHVYF